MKRIAVAMFFYVALFSAAVSVGGATRPKFRPATPSGAGDSRYVVTLVEDAAVDDPAALRHELAKIYGAKLEVDASSGGRQFAVTTSSARARLLSADPRVIEVVEIPPTMPPPSQTPTSSAHFKPRSTGYGDNGQSGTYTYDGAGNITAIGADTFVYDSSQRLVSSVTRGVQENYTYDAYGNRTSATGAVNCLGQTNCAQTVTVDSNTNHLTAVNGAAVTYDVAGNINTIAATSTTPSAVYSYDADGMMTRATVVTDDRQFIYTADDERIAVRQGVSWTWMIRDQSGKVLREFTSLESESGPNLVMSGWQWAKDYIWRDGLLLATVSPSGTLHYHLDHLGTPRLVTDANGVKVAEHAYYPFGTEINLTPHENPEEAMKFTAHERDIVAGDGRTLDYMHARYYSPTFGRFLSVDPVFGKAQQPQSWNRYAYVLNNPLRYTDPDGREHVNEPGLTKPLSEADWSDAPSVVRVAFYGEGALTSEAAAEFLGAWFTTGATVTRYMSKGEADTARRTGNIPNTDAQGNPRPTHVTTDTPMNNSAAAQEKYDLPATPTHRATVPKGRVPGGLGPTPDGRATTANGGGSQSATNQPIPVKPAEIKPLDRSLWDRVRDLFR